MAKKNENKQPLLPELRFPEFQGEGEWQHVSLGNHADIIKERAGKKKYPVMSIETGVGLVSQLKKFGRDISGNSYKNYTVIQKDDFAYNKSATKEFPEGFIAKHEEDNKAAVPNSIFTCFRLTLGEIQSEYLYFQLLNNLHGKWLRKFITVGARAHGALSVNTDDLMNLPVPVPSGASSIAEQQKIADCLDSLDDLIAAHGAKLDALQDHKKGLLQQLFPAEGQTTPTLRFPEFEGAGGGKESTFGEFVQKSLLNTPENQERIQALATRSISQCNINPSTFRNELKIQIPLIAEQQKIADCLSALDALVAAQTEQIAALKDHKKGLMQQLFPNPELSKA